MFILSLSLLWLNCVWIVKEMLACCSQLLPSLCVNVLVMEQVEGWWTLLNPASSCYYSSGPMTFTQQQPRLYLSDAFNT